MENKKRLIDADVVMDGIIDQLEIEWGYEGIREDVKRIFENAPTVDAVEVVRCKDCKHWKPSGSMAGNSEDDLQPIGGCEWAICCRKANDFCSYGERRENGK